MHGRRVKRSPFGGRTIAEKQSEQSAEFDEEVKGNNAETQSEQSAGSDGTIGATVSEK